MKNIVLLLIFIVLCSVCVFGLDVGSKVGTVTDFGEDMTALKDVGLSVEKVDWGSFSSGYPNVVAMGDFDGDGDDDFAFGLYDASENQWFVYDSDGKILKQGGSGWGDIYVTDLAFGNIDGDSKEELAIARSAYTEGIARVVFYDSTGEQDLKLADNWGDDAYPSVVALGDYNNDGYDEIAIARSTHEIGGFSSTNYVRWFVYKFDGNLLFCGGGRTDGEEFMGDNCDFLDEGGNWDTQDFSNGIAFDTYSTKTRLALTRTDETKAWYVYEFSSKSDTLTLEFSSPVYNDLPRDLTFANTPDGVVLILTLQEYDENDYKLYIYNESGTNLKKLGSGWADDVSASKVASGDFDGDGYDEFAVLLQTSGYDFEGYTSTRWYVYDDDYSLMFCGGGSASGGESCNLDMDESWDEEISGTDVAFGDYDGDGDEEILIANDAGDWFVYGYIEEVEETFTLDTSKLDVDIAVNVAPVFTIETEEQIPACSDGVDNDGDGGYDYAGGCFDGETIIEYLECEINLLACNDYCKITYDAYYVNGDPGCESHIDTTEMNRCGDRRDNDWDFTADFTGGCDVDHDYAIDYVCGCDVNLDGWINPTTETMQKDQCASTSKYGCVGLPPITTHYVVDYTLDCETLNGRYLLPDPGCVSMSDDSERDVGFQEYRNIEEAMANQQEGNNVYCTSGERFDAGDGCNTCICSASGLVSDAICTTMSCSDKPITMQAAGGNPDDSLWISFWKWFGLIA